MHNIKLIRRRFPNHSRLIITILFILICLLLAAGLALALLH
ncbi:MAG: hypothetical protein WAM60_07935 [Candidatus Promineifilaceae bacterium]